MELKDSLKEKIDQVAKKYSLVFVIIFGSTASNSSKKNSDIDIAFLSKEKDDFKIYSELYEIIQKAVNDYKLIDLVDLKKANCLLRYEITSKGILIFGDEKKYAEYKIYSFRDYMESRSLFNLESILISKRQKILAEANQKNDQ